VQAIVLSTRRAKLIENLPGRLRQGALNGALLVALAACGGGGDELNPSETLATNDDRATASAICS